MIKLIHALYAGLVELPQQMRWTYLPPLMVYLAAGISGLTAIVGTFFIKDYLNLSAAFLASLGFWAGLPWALKMPLGHLVDLIWKHKSYMVVLGAMVIAASLLIMYGLIGHTAAMASLMPVESWFVISVILGPVGYVIQDVVADAMTVEAVPENDNEAARIPLIRLRRCIPPCKRWDDLLSLAVLSWCPWLMWFFLPIVTPLVPTTELRYTPIFIFMRC